jgi:transposase-like protein
MMASKAGTSALNLQRVLGLGSYQTAWTMLHRYRDVMVVPGRDKLSGDIEVDETFIGGVKPGKRGRGADGKVLVAGAIERAPGGRRGFGRARLAVISSAKAAALRPFITANVSPGSVVISDALSSYPNAVAGPGYEHNPINVKRSGLKAHQVLPGVHRLFSLAKRWLEGTKAASTLTICSPTWTNSSSASTAAPPASAACCSSGCSNAPSRQTRSAT